MDAAYFYAVRPQRAFTQLEAILPPQTDITDRHAKRNDAFCYLAIDECGELVHRLHVLKRLWFCIAPNRTWIMLLDTTASISRTFGTKSFSSKVRPYAEKQHVEPFTGLSHDIELSANRDRYLQILHRKGPEPTKVELIDFLSKMGRPLLEARSYGVKIKEISVAKTIPK
jgi:hypothetical protein